jgi:hypothetical protein
MPPPDDKPKKRELVRPVLDFIFGFRNKRGDVLDGWIYSTEAFSIAPLEFYELLEKQLAVQKFPNVEVSRVEFAEGGLLSNQRILLRFMRERFAIDTCAAPFGGHFFFSCRFVHVPALVRLWHIVAAMIFFAAVDCLLVKPLGVGLAAIALVGLLFAIAGVMRNADAFTDLDTLLPKIPILATVYENWFRMETYYRLDTRAIYKTILPDLIRKAAEDITAAKGLKLVRRDPSAPILRELYPPGAT